MEPVRRYSNGYMPKKNNTTNIIEYIGRNIENIVFIGLKKLENQQALINIRGTGLLLKDKKVVTCAHVYNEIPENERENIFCGIMEKAAGRINNYKSYNLTFESSDDERDFALLQIQDNDSLGNRGVALTNFANLKEVEKVKRGEDLFFSGFSLANELLKMGMGITLTTDKCVVSTIKYRNSDQKINFLLVDKLINPGGSGSPVFYKNKIIGLASGSINRTHNLSGTVIKVPVGIGIIRTSNYLLDLLKK